jgi:hypothetical protein
VNLSEEFDNEIQELRKQQHAIGRDIERVKERGSKADGVIVEAMQASNAECVVVAKNISILLEHMVLLENRVDWLEKNVMLKMRGGD